jgi:hypothetical protein
MSDDLPYRLCLALLCLLGLAIRLHYHWLPGRTAQPITYHEGPSASPSSAPARRRGWPW